MPWNCFQWWNCIKIRENALKKFTDVNATLNDSTGKKVDVGRAKTALQLKRNASLKQASDVLKKDSRCKGQTVEIAWRVDGVDGARSKDRGVKVGHSLSSDRAGHDRPVPVAVSECYPLEKLGETLREPSFASFFKRWFSRCRPPRIEASTSCSVS